ncbi:MAG: PQQ-dependent sugar dehydrogenase [Pseudomonadota bacterium]
MLIRWLGVLISFSSVLACAAPPIERLSLPPGFTISLYAEDVPSARQLAVSPSGVVYAGSRGAGNVYAIVDADGDHRADQVRTIARDLYMPSGVAFHGGALYVAEVNQILRFEDIEADLADPPKGAVIFDELPSESHHGWKFIAFGPDGKLYIPIGVPCNICPENDPYGTISALDLETGALEIYARGIRNSVGFDWFPETSDLWFTDNGRDWLGDDRPPCEINRARGAGLHFGFPYLHGTHIKDPEYGGKGGTRVFTPPVLNLQAHVAPVGMTFYQGEQFPENYKNRLFVAEHGSWNRSRKVGYRVMMGTVDEQTKLVDYRPFVEGWLQGQGTWGRPADIATLPDGSIIISDDQAGVIYRVTYQGT